MARRPPRKGQYTVVVGEVDALCSSRESFSEGKLRRNWKIDLAPPPAFLRATERELQKPDRQGLRIQRGRDLLIGPLDHVALCDETVVQPRQQHGDLRAHSLRLIHLEPLCADHRVHSDSRQIVLSCDRRGRFRLFTACALQPPFQQPPPSCFTTTPAFITKMTRSRALMPERGSSETAIMSAYFPGSREPILS